MKHYLLFLLCLKSAYCVSNSMLFSGIDFCTACMGSKYYMCETNVTQYGCYNNITQCTSANFPVKTNLWDKCILTSNVKLISTDTQCQY